MTTAGPAYDLQIPLPRRACAPGSVRGRSWQRTHAMFAVAIDVMAGAIAAAVTMWADAPGSTQPGASADSLAAVCVPGLWLATLWGTHAHETRFLGHGWEEFRRVLRALVVLTATIGFFSYATGIAVSRMLVVGGVPIAASVSIAGRYGLRRVLVAMRRRGLCLHRVVAVGHPGPVADLIARTRREPSHGMVVVGACLVGPPASHRSFAAVHDGVDVSYGMDDVSGVVQTLGADTVAVAACAELADGALRRLSWQLEATDAQLLVAPGLVEVAGPRIHIRPFSGLPLLHVELPRFSGSRCVLKAVLDRTVAVLALLLLSPCLLAIAVAVRAESDGPAIFRQTRVGRRGEQFTMYKFRSMCSDAENRRAELQPLNECADGLLFKLRRDPRVTRVGGWLRRYSLDELPQLVNVALGHMSLVGPRPPLPDEYAQYADDVSRRLLVKPGMTGLWQVSGRSNLTWEESVRLDLRYVENWSLTLDLLILWRTLFAVARRRGAY